MGRSDETYMTPKIKARPTMAAKRKKMATHSAEPYAPESDPDATEVSVDRGWFTFDVGDGAGAGVGVEDMLGSVLSVVWGLMESRPTGRLS